MKITFILFWGARLVAAFIMLQTLYFKFSASDESVYIFTTLGMEPWGRIGVGVCELVASVLLLINRTAWLGAALATGLMLGAIGMHFTLLGIEVINDGGQLFLYAWLVLIASAYVLFFERSAWLGMLRKAKRNSV
jgi:putative oxidoreductase